MLITSRPPKRSRTEEAANEEEESSDVPLAKRGRSQKGPRESSPGPSSRSIRASTRARSVSTKTPAAPVKVEPKKASGPKIDKGKGKATVQVSSGLIIAEMADGPNYAPLERVVIPKLRGPQPPVQLIANRPPLRLLPHLPADLKFEGAPAVLVPPYPCVACAYNPRELGCRFVRWGKTCASCEKYKVKCSFVQDTNLDMLEARERCYDQMQVCATGTFLPYFFLKSI